MGTKTDEHDSNAASAKGLLGRVTEWAWRLVAIISGLAVIALLVTVIANVSMRYLAGSGIEGANDMVSSWWMVSVAFLGIALAQRANGRIQIDFLVDALPPRMRRIVDVLVLAALAAAGLLFAWFGLMEAVEQMEIGEYAPVGNRPIWPFRYLVPAGFVGFSLACVLSIAGLVRQRPTGGAER